MKRLMSVLFALSAAVIISLPLGCKEQAEHPDKAEPPSAEHKDNAEHTAGTEKPTDEHPK